MSAQKREYDGNESGSSGSKKKPKIPHIPDKEALGVSSIHHNYEPYSILNKIVKDKKTKKDVELKNKEKPREMLAILDMGNNYNIEAMSDKEVIKAINELFERDQHLLKRLLSGEITVEDFGTLRFPEIFLSKVQLALNLDLEEWNRKKKAAIQKGIPYPKIDVGNLAGDFWERHLYNALKNYFEETKDACLIIHGHSFLHQDNFKEKDFIILNLSKGYIMNIEAKTSHQQFNSAKEQIKDCQNRIQAVFNGIEGMSSLWKFVGVCFIGDGGYDTFGKDFVIDGTEDIATKLNKIEHQVNHSQQWIPNEDRIKEFVNVAKFLLFEAQGQHKAPLTHQKLTEKVDEDLDKASAPENLLFWTPEQLSIVQAMHIDWMFLMAYYGCGKTILLIERAEYLLRNPNNTVHFYIDKYDSGLAEVLKLRFAGKNIKIKTKDLMFDSDFDLSSDEVNPSDHVIIDEARMWNSKRFLEQLKRFQSQISTLWVALGYVSISANFNESDFRKGLEDIQFSCPTLKHCLRNGQKIVKEAQKDNTSGYGLSCFADQVEVKSKINVNDGLLHEMPLIYPNPIKALQEAFKVHHSKKNFIFIDYEEEEFEMSTLKEAIPDHDFVNFKNKEGLKKWLESSNINQHLVLQDSFGYYSEVSGMEFQSMIYLSPICLKCGDENKNSSVITRAKASLLLARYEKQNCIDSCKNESYPNLKWNNESKKWEIEQGFTKDQLPKESKQILEKTSNLPSLLFKP